jgi:L-seryl-tRNA(Ser) seleniumtransferase
MMARPDESVVHGSKASPQGSLQNLPSVDRLLRLPAVQRLVAEHGHTLVAREARALVDSLRVQALAGCSRD